MYRRRPFMSSVLLALLVTTASSLHAQTADRDLAYGPDPLQRLDLTTPAAPGFATVVFVHGGSLTGGGKADDDYGRVCAPFVSAGIGCASLDYRLQPAAKWPAQAHDVAAGTAWLRRHITERGGDPDSVFLLGHSSGALLVALVGTDPSYLSAWDLLPGDLAGVLPMGSIMWDEDLEQLIDARGLEAVEEAFAASDEAKMYGSLDVYRNRWPIHHLRSELPPFLFLIAEGETEQPPVLATDSEYARRSIELGNEVDWTVLPDRTHMSAIRRLSEPGDPTFARILAFLQAHAPAGSAPR